MREMKEGIEKNSVNLTKGTKGMKRRMAVPAVAGEESTQWRKTTATTGLGQCVRVLRDAEEDEEDDSATSFVAEQRGRGRGLAGARWTPWPEKKKMNLRWNPGQVELRRCGRSWGLIYRCWPCFWCVEGKPSATDVSPEMDGS
jgi:hypothetical protein